MRMKKEFFVAGILFVATMLFVGCTSNSDSNEQGQSQLQQTSAETNPEQAQGAGPASNDRQRGMRNPVNGNWTPPPEAALACSGKANGTVCEYSANGQTLNGTCRNMPSGQTVCLGGGRGGGFAGNRTAMTSESVNACAGKAEGDVCSFTINDRTIDGTCGTGNGQMGCMPAGRGGPSLRGQEGVLYGFYANF